MFKTVQFKEVQEPAIVAKGIQKTFGNVHALKGIDLEVAKGSIFALLGPNGAGKTTLVRILTTLLKQDFGQASVGGFDIVTSADKVRSIIGLSGQFAAVDGNLTGKENLFLVARLYHLDKRQALERVANLLQSFGLLDVAERTVKTYSGGMRRRLDLTASLIGGPQVLFLDEPTTGLDLRSRLLLWEIIKKLAKEGRTILLTTQYLEEADKLADKIGVLDKGLIVATGSSNKLKSEIGEDFVDLHIKDGHRLSEALEKVSIFSQNSAHVDHEEGKITLQIKGGTPTLVNIIRALDESSIGIEDIVLRRPTLDEVFLKLTGHKT